MKFGQNKGQWEFANKLSLTELDSQSDFSEQNMDLFAFYHILSNLLVLKSL